MTYATPLARNSDPITSHMAADAAKGFMLSHSKAILAALGQLKHATAHEISAYTRLTTVQIDRRLSELKSAGLVARTGQIRNRACEWRLV